MALLTAKQLLQAHAQARCSTATATLQPLYDILFAQQLAFVQSTAPTACAVCSRQAGKTYACCVLMLIKALSGAQTIAYLGLTRQSAANIVWRTLKQLCERFNIKANYNESKLQVTIGRCLIILTGINTENVVETLRGQAYDLVILDESGSVRDHCEYLLNEVIEPALITRRGILRIIGTPTKSIRNYFYLTSNNLNVQQHHWCTTDNPHIPHAQQYLQQIKNTHGYTDDTPEYRREYLGEWCTNEDERLYHVTQKNIIDQVPQQQWYYIIGVDFGWNDANAIVVLAYNAYITNKVYVVYAQKYTKQTISQLAEVLQPLITQYTPQMVADQGGLGRSIIEELNARYGWSFRGADKVNKLGHIKIVNDALRTQRLLITQHAIKLSEEMMNLYDDKLDENHISDSLLYSYMQVYKYLQDNIQSPQPTLKQRVELNIEDDEEPQNDFETLFSY